MIKEEQKKTKIKDLDLPAKITELLLDNDIKTVGDLVKENKESLLDIGGMGPARLKKIKKALDSLGKDLKKKKKISKDRYFESEGRRKTAVARVRIWPKQKGEFTINDKSLKEYFPTDYLRETALASLKEMNLEGKVRVSVIARGGGLSGQAEAVRHGTARALVLYNPDFRNKLKKAGYLTRDSRMKERKKFGHKGARKSPQWSKR